MLRRVPVIHAAEVADNARYMLHISPMDYRTDHLADCQPIQLIGFKERYLGVVNLRVSTAPSQKPAFISIGFAVCNVNRVVTTSISKFLFCQSYALNTGQVLS